MDLLKGELIFSDMSHRVTTLEHFQLELRLLDSCCSSNAKTHVAGLNDLVSMFLGSFFENNSKMYANPVRGFLWVQLTQTQTFRQSLMIIC